MDNLIDDIMTIARRCERAASQFQKATNDTLKRIANASDDIRKSWSGSWLGYHACVYYGNFEIPPSGVHFESEWGLMDRFDRLFEPPDDWREHRYEAVIEEILNRAGRPNLEALNEAISNAHDSLDECKSELIATLNAALAETKDEYISQLLNAINGVKAYSQDELARSASPKGQIVSRDSKAYTQGLWTPPHIAMEALTQAAFSNEIALRETGKLARQTKSYLEKRLQMKGRGTGKTEGKVFIGHGRSSAWRDLKDFLSDRLGLIPDEYNLEPAAGLTTKERLEEMLDAAVFAFIVMTAEDQHADETKHARENVIHEAGLFQGRLGFRRAIILLEDGCAQFSNIEGLTQIRFPRANIRAAFEEIRRVLEREGLARQ